MTRSFVGAAQFQDRLQIVVDRLGSCQWSPLQVQEYSRVYDLGMPKFVPSGRDADLLTGVAGSGRAQGETTSAIVGHGHRSSRTRRFAGATVTVTSRTTVSNEPSRRTTPDDSASRSSSRVRMR